MPNDIAGTVGELTLEDKANLLAGADMWSTMALEQFGITSVRLTDGPNGARGPTLTPLFEDDVAPSSTCFPCGSALGATWDEALVERIGGLIGEDARRLTCRILLAPTVNLHRSPLGGRNFESYSEDPLLAGRLGARFVRGAQSAGVICTVKHFAGNESERDRMFADTIVDERALRELYLLPFEIAVREGGALGMMTGYNRLNGRYCSDNDWLLKKILREEWQFEGIIVSDWFAFASTEEAIKAGLNLEMPGPGRSYGPKLAEAVRRGAVEESLVDDAVMRLLTTLERVGSFDDVETSTAVVVSTPTHRAAAKEAAAASMVLLKNNGVLPIAVDNVRRVALIGPNADRAAIVGGGSANLAVGAVRTPKEAFTDRLGRDVELMYEPGVDIALTTPEIPTEMLTADGQPGMRVEFFAPDDLGGDVRHVIQSASGALTWFGGPPREAGSHTTWRATGTLRVDKAARWVVSLVQTEPAQLLLDGKILLDGAITKPAIGTELFGLARQEMTCTLDLSPDKPVQLEVRSTARIGNILAGAKIGLRQALPEDSIDRAVEIALSADATVLVVGTDEFWESEGVDRESLHLPGAQDELISRVLEVAPNAVVVVNAGSPVAMPWEPPAAAILQCWLGGIGMADALVDVLLGVTEPGGRLPMTIPRRIEDTPSWGNFPATGGRINYAEGILVGYRWYQARKVDVAFPFGHGLSYTRFQVEQPILSSDTFDAGDELTVEMKVRNVGERFGSDVIQLYVAPMTPTAAFRPPLELKAFCKVHLEAGADTIVRFRLDDRSFARWADPDPNIRELQEQRSVSAPWVRPMEGVEAPGWTIDPGRYELRIGSSSENLPIVSYVDVPSHDELTISKNGNFDRMNVSEEIR